MGFIDVPSPSCQINASAASLSPAATPTCTLRISVASTCVCASVLCVRVIHMCYACLSEDGMLPCMRVPCICIHSYLHTHTHTHTQTQFEACMRATNVKSQHDSLRKSISKQITTTHIYTYGNTRLSRQYIQIPTRYFDHKPVNKVFWMREGILLAPG